MVCSYVPTYELLGFPFINLSIYYVESLKLFRKNKIKSWLNAKNLVIGQNSKAKKCYLKFKIAVFIENFSER